MKRIIRNAIQCNNCGDIIESQYRHDYVQCKCGECAVDGGHDYLRRCYVRGGKGFKDLSEVIDRQANRITYEGSKVCRTIVREIYTK